MLDTVHRFIQNLPYARARLDTLTFERIHQLFSDDILLRILVDQVNAANEVLAEVINAEPVVSFDEVVEDKFCHYLAFLTPDCLLLDLFG